MDIKKAIVDFRSLPTDDRLDLIESLKKQHLLCKRDTYIVEPKKCIHCNSTHFISHGKYNGNKRYKCKECNRTFTHETNTAIHRIHDKGKFALYVELMFNDKVFFTLEEMKKKVGISIQTAFDWRHKILEAINQSFDKFNGEVEVDDVNVRYSRKGMRGVSNTKKRGKGKVGNNSELSKVLFINQRNGKFDMDFIGMGKVSADDLNKSLKYRINPNSSNFTLYSDQDTAIKKFSKINNIKHLTFNSTKHTNGKAHVQGLNKKACDFDTMINDTLSGVSTKYLKNYMAWFKFMDNNKENRIDTAYKRIIGNKSAWYKFASKEKWFAYFMSVNSNIEIEYTPKRKEWKSILVA